MTLYFRIGALLRRNLLGAVTWRTNEMALILTLGIGTVLSRLPFRSTLLNSHDAVNYALALHRFDLRLHQPQPPGYPLYILIGRIFKLVFQDDLAALLWVSMVFSGLAVIAMYLVGRDMYNRRTGFICALLAATSSLVWYQSEVAAPYTADLFASAIVGWLCYRALIAPGRRIALLSALALGLAGALRLQTFILLFPLFLFSLRLHPWKTILGASLMAGLVLAIFLAPTIWLSGGGLLSFLDLTFGTVRIFRSSEALAGSVSGLRYVKNLFTVLRYAVFALGELVVLFIPLGYLAQTERWRFWKNSRVLFLVLWTLPTWLLFMLIGTPNRGATLLGTPALFVLGSLGIDWLMRHLRLRFSRPARRAGFDRWGWALGARA
jgi:4-amino-4-deoxy-L-arabinose transferase-like glycosyltransferase